MLILFDHSVPKGRVRALPGHTVITAYARGWDTLDGALLNTAEDSAVELLITTDRRIRYQQNLAGRRIALVVLTGTTKWSRVRLHLEGIAAVVNAATPSSYIEIPSARGSIIGHHAAWECRRQPWAHTKGWGICHGVGGLPST